MRPNDPTNPAFWLSGSFLAIVLVSNAAYLILRSRLADPALRRGPLGAFGWLTLNLFYLLIPFLALQRGALSLYLAGLAEIDWPVTLSTGLALAASVVIVTLFGWLLYRRTLPDGPEANGFSCFINGARAPIAALLQQWHWAFYRAAMAATIQAVAVGGSSLARGASERLMADPFYWGAWLGMALIGIEWALNPFERAALCSDAGRARAIRQASLAIATTGLFVLTRNLWLCLATHLVVETLAATWFALPQEPQPQAD